MSQIWVPWQDNPDRFKLKGIKALVWGPLLVIYALFRRFPGPIFFGGVATVIGLVWLHAAIVNIVTTSILVEPYIAAGTETSFFGGVMSLEEIKAAIGDTGPAWLAYPIYPLTHEFVRDLIGMGGIILLVSLIPLFSIWWERKVSAHIQNRTGPMRVGGWHGWTQTLADGVKLIGKEDLVPPEGDGPLFRIAPYLTFVPSIMAFIALPFSTYWVFRNTDVALVLILALLGIEVVGVILAGWASNNKWSVYGAMREACQMVSYEIPMGMGLMMPIIIAGSMNLAEVGDMQTGGWHTWLCFHNPFMLASVITYYIASLASCKRAPFDLAESESELVAGFLTEYSGFRWSMFFFAEYCAMFVVSGLAVVLYLGAWHAPWSVDFVAGVMTNTLKLQPGTTLYNLGMGIAASGPAWFIIKCVILIYIQMWVRWTLPRIRIDQLLYACVQVMLPLMLVLILGNVLWVLLVPEGSMLDLWTRIILSVVGALFVLGFLRMVYVGLSRKRQLVGVLAVDPLPGS